MTSQWWTNVNKARQRRFNNDFQMSKFNKFESDNIVISALYTFNMLSEVCILNLQREIWHLYWGNPKAIVARYLIHLLEGCAPTMQGF